MAIHLTPGMLYTTYELLRQTPPFKRWKLPHADQIAFHVTWHDDRFGHYVENHRWKFNRIGVSAKQVKTLKDLTEVMAHEMVHVRQHMLGGKKWNSDHDSKSFMAMAAQVCRAHGFNKEKF